MKIFYWAPWIEKLVQLNLLRIQLILEKYSKNHIKTRIIDAVGEWKEFKDHLRYINLRILNF